VSVTFAKKKNRCSGWTLPPALVVKKKHMGHTKQDPALDYKKWMQPWPAEKSHKKNGCTGEDSSAGIGV